MIIKKPLEKSFGELLIEKVKIMASSYTGKKN